MNIKNLISYSFVSGLVKRVINENTTMMYNPFNGDMYELNDVSSVVIDGLCDGLTGQDILKELTTQYDVEESVVIEDIAPFLERLIELKLLIVQQ